MHGSGPGKVDLSNDLSLLLHQSTSEEKHGRLPKRGSGDCRTFPCSVMYLSDVYGEEKVGVIEPGGPCTAPDSPRDL